MDPLPNDQTTPGADGAAAPIPSVDPVTPTPVDPALPPVVEPVEAPAPAAPLEGVSQDVNATPEGLSGLQVEDPAPELPPADPADPTATSGDQGQVVSGSF